jgi:hypothetical protein
MQFTDVSLAAALAVTVFACSGTPDPGASASTGATQTSAALEAPAAGSPAATITAGGTFGFVFDESTSVVDMVKADCAAHEKGDAAIAACVDAVRQEGAKEGFRITGADASHLTWTSFANENGHEVVTLEIPFAIVGADGTFVRARATGAAQGSDLRGRPGPTSITFEVVGPDKVAMHDEHKGRLVFTRQ